MNRLGMTAGLLLALATHSALAAPAKTGVETSLAARVAQLEQRATRAEDLNDIKEIDQEINQEMKKITEKTRRCSSR